jgi:hypothetical protein
VMGALMGSDVRLSGPAELHPPKDVVDLAKNIAGRTGARITVTEDPREAVSGADFIHTDVWVSMGEAKDVWASRVKLLTPYQVNSALLKTSGSPAVKFMHCLPAFHDPNTTVGREIMEHTGMTSGPGSDRRGLQVGRQHRVRPGREPPAHHQGDPRRHPGITAPRTSSGGLGHTRARLRLPACIRAALSRSRLQREVIGKRGERVRL